MTSLVACLAFALFAQTAHANLYEWADGAGTRSVKADLSISGDTLTVKLYNVSSLPTTDPVNALTSFYFDIAGDPTLTYQSATGNVYLSVLGGPDVLQSFTTFRAYSPDGGTLGDGRTSATGSADGWQFKETASFDYGIGTAGYQTPPVPPGDTFGPGVNGGDYAIINNPDVESNNLKNNMLVQGMATFTFDGLSGCSNADLGDVVAFGFGTSGDIVQTPLPGAVLLGFMGLSIAGLKLRKYA